MPIFYLRTTDGRYVGGTYSATGYGATSIRALAICYRSCAEAEAAALTYGATVEEGVL